MLIKYYRYNSLDKTSDIQECNGFVKTIGKESNSRLELIPSNDLEKKILDDGLWLEYCKKLGAKFEINDGIILIKPSDYHSDYQYNQNAVFYFYFSLIRLAFWNTSAERYKELKQILQSNKKYKRISSILIAYSFYMEIRSFLEKKNTGTPFFCGFHKSFYSAQTETSITKNFSKLPSTLFFQYFPDLFPYAQNRNAYLGATIIKPRTFTIKELQENFNNSNLNPTVVYRDCMYAQQNEKFKSEEEVLKELVIAGPTYFNASRRYTVDYLDKIQNSLENIVFLSKEKEKLYRPLLENCTLENCLKFINKIN